MKPEDEAKIAELLRESRDKARGYADFFGWSANRDIEEWGVVAALRESLALEGSCLFSNIVSRGRPNDPPDCEAKNQHGQRVALEVTELVDGRAVHEYKVAKRERRPTDSASWTREKFIRELVDRLTEKDKRFPSLKGAPYPGGYVVVVHTDEPELHRSTVSSYLAGQSFTMCSNITRAFLVLSYDPAVERCPFFELHLS